MALNISHRWESQIEQVAKAQHISTGEALDRVLEAGLELFLPTKQVLSPSDLIGVFSTPDEVASADFALDVAMEDRERRSAFLPNA